MHLVVLMAIRLFYFFFWFIVLLFLEHGVLGLNCSKATCGSHGPEIRFPFRIKDKQPENCGYPGFDVSCTESNNTLLVLPNSVQLYIQGVDYMSQVINASDPQGCLPRQRLNFNASAASPFHVPDYTYDYTLFNCSPSVRDRYRKIPCLSAPEYEVYAINAFDFIDNIDLLSCTKMHNLLTVPYQMYQQANYSTLHLAWTDPRCGSCETKGGRCGRSAYDDTSSSKPKIKCYGLQKQTKDETRKRLKTAGIVVGFFVLALLVIALYYKYNSDRTKREFQVKIESFLDDYKALKPTRFSYADLKRITNEFNDELGQGTYGTVFKGKLSNQILVAVKVLTNSKGNGEEFVNEVRTMGTIHHVNVVRLIGYCADGFRRALVYDYLPNESLQKFICSPDAKNHFLGWKRLQDIVIGIAKGIEYLHQGCDQRILHFDIKPQNILLDNDFNPKIADFGLAKLCSKDKSAVSMTTARGTIGYIAPEVFSRNFGSVSYKSDVYSFGMLVLEMVGGRKNFDDSAAENDEQIYFPEWIYNILEEREDLRLLIDDEGDAKIAKKLAIVGLWCIQWNPVDRPSMKFVSQMLEGEEDNLTRPPNPFSSTVPKRMNANIQGRRLHQELAVIPETE